MSIILAAALAASTPVQGDLHCMAQVIHHEARGETAAGREAVGQVVLNRMRSGRYPRTACGVAFQRGQFSRISRGIRPGIASFEAARRVLSGISRNLIGNRLFFNGFGPNRAIRIGNHRFW